MLVCSTSSEDGETGYNGGWFVLVGTSTTIVDEGVGVSGIATQRKILLLI